MWLLLVVLFSAGSSHQLLIMQSRFQDEPFFIGYPTLADILLHKYVLLKKVTTTSKYANQKSFKTSLVLRKSLKYMTSSPDMIVRVYNKIARRRAIELPLPKGDE